MLVDPNSPHRPDALASAKERLRIGPVPSWAVACPFDVNFKAKQTEQLTYLLLNRQIHAEHGQTYVHTAMRLETMQAVQHESQWRLQFEPRTQSLTLHWIKIRRGDVEVDHANLERIRLLQREEGLEGFVIDGWFTLLLVLDDVRPGDVLESCYTVENHPRLLPEYCVSYFSLPQGIPVGKYQFSVRFAESRSMKWKSSSADLKPVESRDGAEVVWVWMGENLAELKPETSTPEWHISYPWIQVSDCPDWGMVATAISKAWKQDDADATLAEIANDIAGKESDLLLRVEKAIQMVQDEYRYLSINIELGGDVPSAPGAVARRRFGDCKDLSFLLVHLLKRLGVSARPVLVNTTLRKSVAGMLPMPSLFNHVVVEFQVAGKTRWVDATMKRQGGDALNRMIPNYGIGLPVDAAASKLVEPPIVPEESSVYELKETILLDTTGAPSLLAVLLQTKGAHAEMLRHQFETVGIEEVAKERLHICNNRFCHAKRVGSLEHRDNRAANEFVLAEAFEINGFLAAHQNPGFCRFLLPPNLVVSALQMPEKTVRQTPLAIPNPCNLTHIIEVESPALEQIGGPRCYLGNQWVEFRRRHKSLLGYWSMTLTLNTLKDAVPSDRIDEHRKMLEEIWRESSWELTLPVGYAHPRKRRDFGALPLAPPKPDIGRKQPASAAAKSVEISKPHEAGALIAANVGEISERERPARVTTSGSELERPFTSPALREPRSRRRRSRKSRNLLWPVIISVIFIALVLVIILAARNPPQ